MSDDKLDDDRIKVLIVDDTRTVRALLRAILSRHPRIEIVGEAGDPYEARGLIRALDPDVVTLDVEMPRMDGLSFLERLMRLRPTPVVMVSCLTTHKSHAAIRALSLGAIDCVDTASLQPVGEAASRLVETVLMAADSKPRMRTIPKVGPPRETRFDWNGKVVVIGSSTGGVDALIEVLSSYPTDGPPTVVAQHMPEAFLASFAARLDRMTPPHVVLAEDGMRLRQGLVCLGRGGDRHVTLSRRDPLCLSCPQDTGTETYVPSVDKLFSSAVPHAKKAIGVMLTGMGRDGAHALLRMHGSGAHCIVQDAETALIDGMPRAARELGAASEVVELSKIGARIVVGASDRRTRDT